MYVRGGNVRGGRMPLRWPSPRRVVVQVGQIIGVSAALWFFTWGLMVLLGLPLPVPLGLFMLAFTPMIVACAACIVLLRNLV